MTQHVASVLRARSDTTIKPELIVFTSDRCAPSQLMMAAALQTTRGSRAKISLRQVNIANEPALTEQHHILGTPTLLLIVGTEILGRHLGVLTAAELADWIGASLASVDYSPS